MLDGLRRRSLGVVIAVVVASGLLPAAGCLPLALTSAATGDGLDEGELPSQFIKVNYSVSYTPKLVEYSEARAGSIYLVLDLEIKNHGYDSFSTNPMLCSVIIGDEEYRAEVVLIGDDLAAVGLADGGSTSGRLAFLVPRSVEGTRLELKYTPFWGRFYLITNET